MFKPAISRNDWSQPLFTTASASNQWGIPILLTLIFWFYILVSPSQAGSGIPVRTAPNEVKQLLHIFDQDGYRCGVGEYVQTISQDENLRVELNLDIHGNSTLREVVEMKQSDVLQPIRFLYELSSEDRKKTYQMDFKSGYAVRNDQNGSGVSKKEAVLEFEPAKTFAGVMLILVALNFPEDQRELDLHVVVFTPKPRVIQIKMLKQDTEQITIGGREVLAVKYRLSPAMPAIARVLVGDSHDQTIWLSQSGRPTFLCFEGSIETGGPQFRIESQKYVMAYQPSQQKDSSASVMAAR